MQNNIRIIRLKDSQDIISAVEFKEGYITLYDPLLMHIQPTRNNQGQLLLMNWLPQSLIVENVATLNNHDILLTMIPNDEMVEHYLDVVEKSKSIKVKSMDELTEEELANMMEVIHEVSKSNKDLIFH